MENISLQKERKKGKKTQNDKKNIEIGKPQGQ